MTLDKLMQFNVIIEVAKPQDATDQVLIARRLINVARRTNARLIFIVGAACLEIGNDDHFYPKDLRALPSLQNKLATPKYSY